MLRLFIIAFTLIAIEKIHVVSVLIQLTHELALDLYSRYQYGFIRTYMFLVIPFFLAGMIDWNIVYTMFFPKTSGKFNWRIFIVLNWICSSVVVLAFTHLLTYADKVITIRNIFLGSHSKLNTENRIALIAALLSIAYLIGFFCVSLVMNDLRYNTSARNMKFGLVSYVPPVYYLGVAGFAWQLDSSFTTRMFIAIACTFLFAAISISHKVKENRVANKPIPSSTETSNKEPINEFLADSSLQNLTASNYTLYRLGNMSIKYRKEFIHDIFIYIVPLSLYGYFVPSTRLLLTILSCILAVILPIFDFFATRAYLSPSKPEDLNTVATRLATYPYQGKCYANGWYHSMDSCDLLPGKAVYISMNGIDYVIWRGQDTMVRCIDAHCIHLGANLGIDGQVVDNCIECPFHKWRFDGEGQCTHIPYQTTIPSQAKTKSYYVCEYYGMILIWFHSRHEKPTYFPPRIESLDSDEMMHRGSKSTIVNMHLNEFAENTTDFAHFALLHGKMTIPFTLIEVPGIKITHRPGWKEGENEESHMCWFSDCADLNFCGIDIPHTAATGEFIIYQRHLYLFICLFCIL